jgi:adiponectin receptor
LSELEKRLAFIESCGEAVAFDCGGISRAALETLQAVRDQCSQTSHDVIGAGRRRLQIMVDTLDAGYIYHEALTAAGSLHEKARVGIDICEEVLADIETRSHKLRDDVFAGAAPLVGEGRRVVDEGIGRAIRAAETLEEHIQTAIARAHEKGHILYEDLPMPWRNNPHILKGYRFTESKLECVWSAFEVSNESVNIWSHAIGLVLVLGLALYLYPSSINFELSSTTDVVVAALFFTMACGTLICSTIWHTMNAISDVHAISTFACVDYTGISLLVAASIMTTEYTAFYCDPLSRWTYMTATALFGLVGVVLPWHPKFNGSHMAWVRVCFYVGLSLTGSLPMLQLCYTHGPAFVARFYAPISKSLLVYFGGAIVYASKVPERWFPGMFDYCGCSHNLWHAAVLGGIFFHYTAMQDFFSDAFARAAVDGCTTY